MGSFRDRVIECTVCGLLIVSIYSHQCPNELPNIQFSTYVKPLNNNFNLACELKNGGLEPPEPQNTTTTTTSSGSTAPFSGTASSTATGGTFLPLISTTTTI